MDCIYCGKEIINQKRTIGNKDYTEVYISSEHVIPNALGGLLESYNICCDKCNNLLSKQDEGFAANFSPFVPLIDNYHQTRKPSVKPKHKGKGQYNGEWYDIVLEGNRPVSCAEFSNKYKTGKMPEFDIIKHEIGLDNNSFKNGMQKIAVNFARYSGINREMLTNNFEIKTDKDGYVCQIDFRQQFLPFVPLNSVDKYIEQTTLTNLYHMLILFSANSRLYCYIDLFNTWQGYIILSKNYDGEEIYNTYVQVIQSWERPEFDIRDIRRPKDMIIFKQQYGYGEDISGTMEEQVDKIIRIANEKIQKESYKRELESFICDRIGLDYANYVINDLKDIHSLNAHRFYFFIDGHEQEHLRKSAFRRLTPLENENIAGACSFYPEIILSRLCNGKYDITSKIREYCYLKIARLNDYLSHNEEEKYIR